MNKMLMLYKDDERMEERKKEEGIKLMEKIGKRNGIYEYFDYMVLSSFSLILNIFIKKITKNFYF